jgi:hypothetical protein
MLVDETVGRKATRSVVWNKHMKGESQCYYSFVLKWETGNGEALDFSVPDEPEKPLPENTMERKYCALRMLSMT